MEQNNEKQTPFMKRVAELEKKVKILESKLETLLKVLRNRG
jgi:hypothetical protein